MKNKKWHYLILAALVNLIACKKEDIRPVPQAKTATAKDSTIVISSDQTWKAGVYHINYLMTINHNAVLTLDPGVIIEFGSNANLSIIDGGALKANGTATDSIIFTGEQPLNGHWGAIQISSASENNSFSYCQFLYGGALIYNSNEDGMVGLYYGARAVFKNCTFSFSANDGLYCKGNVSIEGSVNNTFTGNAEFPVVTAFGVVSGLSPSNDYSGNGRDYVAVCYGFTNENDVTFNKIDIPYLVGGIGVSMVTKNIVVKPGVTLVMNDQFDLEIDSTGSFYCVGTPADRITIKGFNSARGAWDKIRFAGSSSRKNQIQYTDIKDGGANYFDYMGYSDLGMITSIASASGLGTTLTVSNCSFSNCLNYGIYFTNCLHSTFNGINGTDGSQSIHNNLQSSNSFSDPAHDVYTSNN